MNEYLPQDSEFAEFVYDDIFFDFLRALSASAVSYAKPEDPILKMVRALLRVARLVTSGFALSFHNAQRFSIVAFSLIFLPLRRQ